MPFDFFRDYVAALDSHGHLRHVSAEVDKDWELSTMFSGGQSGEQRFKTRNWTRLATGSPVLIDALVCFDCRVVKSVVHGTHTIFLGEVAQVAFGKKGKPLLYSEGQYAKLASLTLGEPLPEGLDYWGF